MGAYIADGTRKTKANLPVTSKTQTDPEFTADADLFTDRPMAGEEANFRRPGGKNPSGRTLWKKMGETVKQSEIDAVFKAAAATSITPATGPAAGGTVVTIKGTSLDGITGVTFDGVAATAVSTTDPATLKCTTPAHAAGAVTVVLADDSGSINKPSFFSFA